MKTRTPVAPRIATTEPARSRREGRNRQSPFAMVAAGAAAALVIALGACSPPAGSTAPILPSIPASLAVPSIELPSVDTSAAASVAASIAAEAGLAALDKVDSAIDANTSATGLTADDATLLKQLTAGIRTALQSGDTAGAKTALDDLSTKVQGLSSKLTGTTGTQLTDAINALKAAIPAS